MNLLPFLEHLATAAGEFFNPSNPLDDADPVSDTARLGELFHNIAFAFMVGQRSPNARVDNHLRAVARQQLRTRLEALRVQSVLCTCERPHLSDERIAAERARLLQLQALLPELTSGALHQVVGATATNDGRSDYVDDAPSFDPCESFASTKPGLRMFVLRGPLVPDFENTVVDSGQVYTHPLGASPSEPNATDVAGIGGGRVYHFPPRNTEPTETNEGTGG